MSALAVEDRRIAMHLAHAEHELRRTPSDGLEGSRRTMRARAIEALREYRIRGRFPRNPRFAPKTPFFIDDGATRCAMAWVLERAGAIGLVERVARSANNATIAELSRDAELLHWLDELGMTPGEAGLVQPSYCFYKKGDCLCRQTSGAWPSADQVVTGVVLSHDAGTTFPVRVETLLGGDARTAVGDELSIDGTATGGTNVLVALIHGDGGPIIALRIPAERAGETVCGDPAFGIAIDRSDVVNALLAKDCLAALGAKDARFLEPVCTDAFETGTVSDATASDSGTRDASADSRASTTDAATGDAGDPSVAASQSSGCAMHGFERSDAPVVIALVATVIVSRRLRRARR